MKKRILFIISIFFISCGAQRVHEEPKLTCLRITEILPYLDNNKPGKIGVLDTSVIDFYFYNGLRIYKMPYTFDSTVENKSKYTEIRHNYFVHSSDSLYGKLFDPANNIFNRRVSIDSATIIKQFSDLQLKTVFELMQMKLLSKRTNKDSGTIHEEYYFENKKDSTEKGLLYLSYSDKLNNIPFHLSDYMDSVSNSKLFFYKMIGFGRPLKNLNFTIDTLTAIVKMEKINPPDSQTVMKYIHAFQNK